MATRKTASPRKKVAKPAASTRPSTSRQREAKQASVAQAVPIAQYERILSLQRHLALWYGLQAVAILLLAGSYSVAVYAPFLAVNTLSATDVTTYAPAIWQLCFVSIGWLVGLTLAAVAILSVLATTRYAQAYLRLLEQGRHLFQIITAALALTATSWLLALLLGLGSVPMLLLITVSLLTALTALYLFERRFARPATLIVGAISFLALPVIFISTVAGSSIWGMGVPGYIYGLLATLLAYGVVVLLIVLRVRAKVAMLSAHLRRERLLSIALFVLQSLLAWQIFMGVLL